MTVDFLLETILSSIMLEYSSDFSVEDSVMLMPLAFATGNALIMFALPTPMMLFSTPMTAETVIILVCFLESSPQ